MYLLAKLTFITIISDLIALHNAKVNNNVRGKTMQGEKDHLSTGFVVAFNC